MGGSEEQRGGSGGSVPGVSAGANLAIKR